VRKKTVTNGHWLLSSKELFVVYLMVQPYFPEQTAQKLRKDDRDSNRMKLELCQLEFSRLSYNGHVLLQSIFISSISLIFRRNR